MPNRFPDSMVDMINCKDITTYLHGADSGSLDIFINIALVARGGRPATLVEHSNLGFDPEKIDAIHRYIAHLNKSGAKLSVTPWGVRHFFVHVQGFNMKTVRLFLQRQGIRMGDEQVGKVLQFKCAGQTGWNDFRQDRLVLNVLEESTGKSVYTEVCVEHLTRLEDLQTHGEQLVARFNRALGECGFLFKMEIEKDTGAMKRLDRMQSDDIRYIRENMDSYLNDLENSVNTPKNRTAKMLKRAIKSASTWRTHKHQLTHMYRELVINEKLQNDPEIREQSCDSPSGEKILTAKLLKLEDRLWTQNQQRQLGL